MIKKYLTGEGISPPARLIMKLSLIFSCLMLAVSLVIELHAGTFSTDTYELHYLAAELYRIPQGVLLAAFVAAAVVNEL